MGGSHSHAVCCGGKASKMCSALGRGDHLNSTRSGHGVKSSMEMNPVGTSVNVSMGWCLGVLQFSCSQDKINGSSIAMMF